MAKFQPREYADTLNGFLSEWVEDKNLVGSLRIIFGRVIEQIDKATHDDFVVRLHREDAISLVSYLYGYLRATENKPADLKEVTDLIVRSFGDK